MAALDTRRAKLSGAELHRLESLLLDFDRNWNDTRLAACARELPADCPWRAAALIEMVKIDLEKQWQRGRKPKVEAYVHFYPELGTRDNLPADLLLAEYQARSQSGDGVDLDEMVRRFPRQAAELRRLIAEGSASAIGCRSATVSRQTASLRESTEAEGSAVRAAVSLPETFGRYRIVRQLGEGGMATVYLAEDSQLGRQIALKVPKLGDKNDSATRARFLREARASATLDHPNICSVFEVGESGGIPYLTMAFVEGKPLSHFVRGDKPLSPRDAVTITVKVARALTEAHSRGVVHRDLKPSNIMINRRKEPVVMDFGLARCADKEDLRLTREGAILGTPAYMPPEQINSDAKAIGPCCDIYSLGVVFYELLTGRLPFEGPLASVFAQVLTQEPAPPSTFRSGLDPRLEAICLKAMAKRPQDRHASMADFAAALADWQRCSALPPVAQAVEDAGPKPPPPPSRTDGFSNLASPTELIAPSPRLAGAGRRPRWRGRAGIATAAAAIGALLLGIIIYVTTDNGTIEIELNDPPSDVKVEVDGKAVTIKNKNATYRVSAGKHHLLVTGDGFETHSESFSIVRGEKKPVTVTLRPKQAIAKKDPPLPKEDPVGAFFNGKDLKGWEGLDQYWKVEDGAIVGALPSKLPFNTFLCSKETYRDFELSFQVRLKDGQGNSGVQIRSEVFDRDKFRVKGPQADMGGTFWGSLYGEAFGGMMQASKPEEVKKAVKESEFNDYSIRCIDKHVTIKINGETMVDNNFPQMPDEGIIAWQLHGGTPMEVTFKNIKFKDLTKGARGPFPSPEFRPLFKGKDLEGWDADSGDPDSWRAEGKALVCVANPKNQGWLLTRKDYGDFVLRLDFQLSAGANSGVTFRANPGDPKHVEIQLLDESAPQNVQTPEEIRTGSLWKLAIDQRAVLKPVGAWNTMEIEVRGRKLRIAVNGQDTLNTDLDRFASQAAQLPGLKRPAGRIGLQNWSGTVRFRKVEIRDLAE